MINKKWSNIWEYHLLVLAKKKFVIYLNNNFNKNII